MKKLLKNTTLSIAVAISVLAHAAILFLRFTVPEAFNIKPSDAGLEIILVNAKHDKKPLKADALAQANLDGGGNADSGRAKSPLPDMREFADGDSLKALKHKSEALEDIQKRALDQLRKSTPFKTNAVTKQSTTESVPTPEGTDTEDSTKAIARTTAEILQMIEDQNKRPRKTFISPSTREVGYAMYYKNLEKRVEDIGTLNFPQQNGKKLYGEMMVSISIFQDGSLYKKEGVAIERSSGNPALDRAAVNIVKRSAPFGPFPAKERSVDKDDVWVFVIHFNFTRENKMEADLRGRTN